MEVRRCFKEITRVCRDGARFFFSEPNMLNPWIMAEKNIPWIKRRLDDSPEETAFFRWRLKKLLNSLPGIKAEIRNIEREKIQEAVKRGEAIASTLEEKAREKSGQFLAKAESEIEREVRAARLDLRKQTVDMAILAAEKIIKEKLDDQKHRQLIEEFITRLGETRAQ